jgi:hypothetical protein
MTTPVTNKSIKKPTVTPKAKGVWDDTTSKTSALTVDLTMHDVKKSVATFTANPDSSGNACHDEQQQKEQSRETKERNESNTEDPKMQENNINTGVRGSTVSKKTMVSILKNIAYSTHLI